MNELINMKYVAGAVIFSLVGIVILFISFWCIQKITHENLWKDIVEKQNKAIALVVAAFILAIGMIISAAIHS